uniref:Uncharacterized protein n=1 Tax=Chromera velia CCMP2878 TaxID=1169474 RepID=A0A0G4HN27_9ALVE|eukprot:Cvel_1170.t1-p1 / transcript=Cvel_1170.t1 / gene=Cvel_1170 / organism=Chromera_velia_CCMP2878 / gene_product=hypothetical protein / transcript_product=hypothetical protein / location=Cvel_scaffold39:8295-14256(+) / protein_length=564 / sequence_SO=supercontig / SO=protein_coding / is_pseudo=false
MSGIFSRVFGQKDDGPKATRVTTGLGGANTMYYNEDLKRWVERGKENEVVEEKPPSPPPVDRRPRVPPQNEGDTASPPRSAGANPFRRAPATAASRYVNPMATNGTGPQTKAGTTASRLPGIPNHGVGGPIRPPGLIASPFPPSQQSVFVPRAPPPEVSPDDSQENAEGTPTGDGESDARETNAQDSSPRQKDDASPKGNPFGVPPPIGGTNGFAPPPVPTGPSGVSAIPPIPRGNSIPSSAPPVPFAAPPARETTGEGGSTVGGMHQAPKPSMFVPGENGHFGETTAEAGETSAEMDKNREASSPRQDDDSSPKGNPFGVPPPLGGTNGFAPPPVPTGPSGVSAIPPIPRGNSIPSGPPPGPFAVPPTRQETGEGGSTVGGMHQGSSPRQDDDSSPKGNPFGVPPPIGGTNGFAPPPVPTGPSGVSAIPPIPRGNSIPSGPPPGPFAAPPARQTTGEGGSTVGGMHQAPKAEESREEIEPIDVDVDATIAELERMIKSMSARMAYFENNQAREEKTRRKHEVKRQNFMKRATNIKVLCDTLQACCPSSSGQGNDLLPGPPVVF